MIYINFFKLIIPVIILFSSTNIYSQVPLRLIDSNNKPLPSGTKVTVIEKNGTNGEFTFLLLSRSNSEKIIFLQDIILNNGFTSDKYFQTDSIENIFFLYALSPEGKLYYSSNLRGVPVFERNDTGLFQVDSLPSIDPRKKKIVKEFFEITKRNVEYSILDILFPVFISISIIVLLWKYGIKIEKAISRKYLFSELRNLFHHSDLIVRKFIFILGCIGSALIIDLVYGLDFLPNSLDLWIKRLAPALILISIALYITSIISKRIYLLSEIEKDSLLRSYEIVYYILVIFFLIYTLIFFLGLPIENSIPSSREFSKSIFRWPKNILKIQGVIVSQCIIWLISLSVCIISRYLEWSWMIIKKENKDQVQL